MCNPAVSATDLVAIISVCVVIATSVFLLVDDREAF